jgi:hypothetical protein
MAEEGGSNRWQDPAAAVPSRATRTRVHTHGAGGRK